MLVYMDCLKYNYWWEVFYSDGDVNQYDIKVQLKPFPIDYFDNSFSILSKRPIVIKFQLIRKNKKTYEKDILMEFIRK